MTMTSSEKKTLDKLRKQLIALQKKQQVMRKKLLQVMSSINKSHGNPAGKTVRKKHARSTAGKTVKKSGGR